MLETQTILSVDEPVFDLKALIGLVGLGTVCHTLAGCREVKVESWVLLHRLHGCTNK